MVRLPRADEESDEDSSDEDSDEDGNDGDDNDDDAFVCASGLRADG